MTGRLGQKSRPIIRYAIDGRNEALVQSDVQPHRFAGPFYSHQDTSGFFDVLIALQLVERCWIPNFVTILRAYEEMAGQGFLKPWIWDWMNKRRTVQVASFPPGYTPSPTPRNIASPPLPPFLPQKKP